MESVLGRPALLRLCLCLTVAVEASCTDSGARPDLSSPDLGDDTGQFRPGDVGTPDSGRRDTGTEDLGLGDTGTRDAGVEDFGLGDSGAEDIGPGDTETRDSGPGDAGVKDFGPGDSGTWDTGAMRPFGDPCLGTAQCAPPLECAQLTSSTGFFCFQNSPYYGGGPCPAGSAVGYYGVLCLPECATQSQCYRYTGYECGHYSGVCEPAPECGPPPHYVCPKRPLHKCDTMMNRCYMSE